MSSVPPSPPPDWPVGEPYPPDPVVAETVVVPPGPPLPPPVLPPPEPGNRIGLGMLLAILFLAAIAAVLAVVFFTRHHDHKAAPARTVVVTTTTPGAATPVSVPVPSLVGLRKADALTQLRRAGFKVTVVTATSTSPAGTVLSQDPAGGTNQPNGTAVQLNVSSGSATAGAATTPAATTTAPAATTTAAAQPTSASVPTLSGGARDAITQLDSAGFLVTIAYVPATTALGNVVSQSPAGDQTAQTGSHVTVNLSSGKDPGPAKTIPDLSGKTVNEAVAALHAAGLRLVELKKPVTDQTEAGKVVEQSPAPGKTAPQNAQVLIYWGALQK